MDESVRAPLMIPEGLTFGDDAIIRTDGPTALRCGSVTDIPVEATRGTKCRTGCKTKDHVTYAECLLDAGIGTFLVKASMGQDATEQKRWDRELDSYKAARKEGMQPDGTTQKKIDEARRLSDKAGAGYGKDFSKATPMEAA